MEKAIRTPLPSGGLGWTAIDQREIDAVTGLLKTPQKLFRYDEGEKRQCDLLERELCEKTGASHALFVASGTAALSCCLSAYEIGPGDEVIVPAYTYIATAAAVCDVGAVPVIAEIDYSLGLDPADVEKKLTPYTKAIIVVHMQGVPARLDAIRAVAVRHGLVLIEDCCQAIGATYHGDFCGVHSHAFAWSTNYYKVLTSGEGGVFFVRDDDAFQRGLYQSDSGMTMWKTSIESVLKVAPFSRSGVRGNEIAAAIMRVQLTKLDEILKKTRGLKKLLLSKLNAPAHYSMQYVDDPEGDCGFSVTFIANSREECKKMNAMLLEEGLALGSVYDTGFPDRHIYANWDSILNKNGATPLNYPWNDPAYKGDVSYSKDMYPQTLDILSRSLRFAINLNMTERNMLEVAEAINKVDAAM